MAESGTAPAAVQNPPGPQKVYYNRPQVFAVDQLHQLEVAMTPLAAAVTVFDEDDKPVAGMLVMGSPNVGWWNDGSQIYCHPLARGERLLRGREYLDVIEKRIPVRSW